MGKIRNRTKDWTGHRFTDLSLRDGTVQPTVKVYSQAQKSETITYGDNYAAYKQRLAQGIQCTTTLSGTFYNWSASPIFAYSDKIDWPGQITAPSDGGRASLHKMQTVLFPNNGFPKDNGNLTPLQTADNRALVSFIQDVRRQQVTFQGGTFLGELGEALHMIRNPAESLRAGLSSYLSKIKKSSSKLRRLSPSKRLKKAQEIVSQTWLEYAFGWRPLVSDINDAAKLLADHLHASRTPIDQPVKGIANEELSDRPTVTGQDIATWLTVNYSTRHSYSNSVKYYGKVRVDHPGQATWERSGLWLDSFAPTVWELIPYSFLVDYFTNIGDLIYCASTCLANLSWTARTTYEVERSDIYVSGVDSTFILVNGVLQKYGAPYLVSPGNARAEVKRIVRAPYNGSFVPTFGFKIPGMGTKWINILALGSQHVATVRAIQPRKITPLTLLRKGTF